MDAAARAPPSAAKASRTRLSSDLPRPHAPQPLKLFPKPRLSLKPPRPAARPLVVRFPPNHRSSRFFPLLRRARRLFRQPPAIKLFPKPPSPASCENRTHLSISALRVRYLLVRLPSRSLIRSRVSSPASQPTFRSFSASSQPRPPLLPPSTVRQTSQPSPPVR